MASSCSDFDLCACLGLKHCKDLTFIFSPYEKPFNKTRSVLVAMPTAFSRGWSCTNRPSSLSRSGFNLSDSWRSKDEMSDTIVEIPNRSHDLKFEFIELVIIKMNITRKDKSPCGIDEMRKKKLMN